MKLSTVLGFILATCGSVVAQDTKNSASAASQAVLPSTVTCTAAVPQYVCHSAAMAFAVSLDNRAAERTPVVITDPASFKAEEIRAKELQAIWLKSGKVGLVGPIAPSWDANILILFKDEYPHGIDKIVLSTNAFEALIPEPDGCLKKMTANCRLQSEPFSTEKALEFAGKISSYVLAWDSAVATNLN